SLNGPTYDGLSHERYVSMLELPNPMHRMWSDFRWNKMILAHGCYWKKCTFCDVSLDYIERYEPARVETLLNSIDQLVKETNQTGFHFVDEAAPPALVKSLSQGLIDRKTKISWWGNLRFDKQFEHLAELMADSGCVAVTGGLEVGSPRVLKLIDKGTTVEQVARVTKAFTDAGIFVHAYLMYGFPSQTVQETIDSLEVVRQLFVNECIHSGYWHRFMCTAHSPVGKTPEKYGIELIPIETPKEGLFAKNTIYFNDSITTDLDMLGEGLRKALYNYMHGMGLDEDVRAWFDADVPKAQVAKNFIAKAIQ
ncbi:MAG: radical SAM protein, partial [Bacteriovoracaceae bacterium]|nr:radical SAM protein [Bacteriovoracaceae bacterium]